MALVRLPSGEEYDIPDTDLEVATSQYGATPVGPAPAPADFPPASQAGGANPFTEAAGAATQGLSAIGGPRALLFGGGLGLAGLAGRALFRRAAPSATETGLVRLNKADIATHPEFANFKPGETISRERYESVKVIDTKAQAGAAKKAGMARREAARIASPEAAEAMKPRTKGGRTIGPLKGGAAPDAPPRAGAPAAPPALSVVEGNPRAAAAAAEPPRHSVKYYSASRGEHINIEDMNQKHIEQAYRQLAARNPKPGSVARAQMDALLEEAKYRLLKTDIHIGQAEPPRAAAGRAGRAARIPGAGGTALTAALLLLGAANTQEQVNEAAQEIRRLMAEQEKSPSLRRALTERQTGS